MRQTLAKAVFALAFAAAAIVGLSAATPHAAFAADITTVAQSIHMPDGVDLAADIVRQDSSERRPTVLVMTRYGRATRMSANAVKSFAESGVALVFVDMRGSGASQGHIGVVFSREERADIAAILQWISAQPWSNGRVVATGVSYDANLAALTLASQTKTIAAVVPRFIDYDTYRDLAVPGGVRNEMLLREWGALTDALDHGLPCLISAAQCARADNLKPLNSDHDLRLLRRALLDHQRNWHAYGDTVGYQFDDDVTPSGQRLREGFLSSQAAILANAKAPVQIWGSWFDASTADSALAWYAAAPRAPIELYLGAWTHGGGKRVDPLLPPQAGAEAGAPNPPQVFLDFAGRALTAPAAVKRRIVYYTAGAAAWRTTVAWPPRGVERIKWYLDAQGGLKPSRPTGEGGKDNYAVDFTATTGKSNRWTTQLGGGPVDYGDRREADRKLLAYTSAPLDRDIEITGAPTLTLRLASTHPDGALFVYLEAVANDGRVVYLSEGELRLALRDGNGAGNLPNGLAPSFLRADMAPLVPGAPIDIAVRLHTLSAVVPKGYRLRIAFAGADADTFGRYPSEGDPTYSIFRSREAPAFVELPQADWHGAPTPPN